MPITDRKCVGHDQTTAENIGVGFLDGQAGIGTNFFPVPGQAAALPGTTLEVFFFLNITTVRPQTIINNTTFGQIIPCFSCVYNGGGNFQIVVRSQGSNQHSTTLTVPVETEHWYHLVVRASKILGRVDFYLGRTGVLRDGGIGTPDVFPYGIGNGAATVLTPPIPATDFVLLPFHNGTFAVGEVHRIGLGGVIQNFTPDFGDQLRGGFAEFRVWGTYRSDLEIGQGLGPTAFNNVDFGTPGLEHGWRFNETVVAATAFDDMGPRNAQMALLEGGVASNASGFASSPFPFTPVNYPLPLTEEIVPSEGISIFGGWQRNPLEAVSAGETPSKVFNSERELFERTLISENLEVELHLSLDVDDAVTASELRDPAWTDTISAFSRQPLDTNKPFENVVAVAALNTSATEEVSVTETVSRVLGFGGGGGGGNWEAVVQSHGVPNFWFKLDETSGTTADNAGTDGAVGDATYTGATLNQSPVVIGGTAAVDFSSTGHLLADSQLSWFIPPGTTSSATFVIWVDLPNINEERYLIERLGNFFVNILADNRVRLSVVQSGAGALTTSPAITAPGIHMISFTIDNAGVGQELYLNGAQIGTQPGALGEVFFQNFRFTEFGSDAQEAVAGTTGFNCKVDEVVMWQGVALTAAQHAALYTAGSTFTPTGRPVDDANSVTEDVVVVRSFSDLTLTEENSVTETLVPVLGFNFDLDEGLGVGEATLVNVVSTSSDWSVGIALDTNPSLVGGSGSHTDFPAYIDITDNALKLIANGGSVTSASGFDIAFFTDAAGTVMADFDRLTYDGTNGRVRAFVKIPSLSTSLATTMYLFIGNSLITTEQGTGDTYTEYVASPGGIYHLDDAIPAVGSGVDAITESSASANHADGGANHTTTHVASNDETDTPVPALVNTGWERLSITTADTGGVSDVFARVMPNNDVTFQCWVHGKSWGTSGGPSSPGTADYPSLNSFSQYLFGYGVGFNNAGMVVRNDFDGTVTGTAGNLYISHFNAAGAATAHDTGYSVLSFAGELGDWTFLAVTWDGSVVRFFVNGVIQMTSGATTMRDTTAEDTCVFFVGNDANGANNSAISYDELWYGVGTAHPEGFINAMYNSQIDGTVDPANFWTGTSTITLNQYLIGIGDENSVTETPAVVVEHIAGLIITDESEIIGLPLEGAAALAVVNIWNIAMTALGIATIASTSENSPQATLLNTIWGDFRQQWLTQNRWNGAKTTQALTAFQDVGPPAANVTIPGNRWERAFLLPDSTDSRPYLQALTINGRELTPDQRDFEIEVVENDAGTLRRCLLTNESAVKLEYIFDVTDTNIDLLMPTVKFAIGMSLAVYVAPHFGKSASDINALKLRADDAAVEAKATDSQEGTFQRFQNNPLLDARR